MKYLDYVRVIVEKEKYTKEGIHEGMEGCIYMPEIRNGCFFVNFIDKNFEIHKNEPEWFEEHYEELKDDINISIKIEDLELIKDNGISDEKLLKAMQLLTEPKLWWCKVENGYITNLLGEKKNKIPYDYNS